MSKIAVLLGVFTLFGVFIGFSNFAFAVPENPMSDAKPDFPESIKIGEKATFYLKMSNLEYDRVSDIEPIITIMPKDASEFVHVEINPQISTLWHGYYQTTKGTIYVDKGIPVDRIFVSVSFMGNNQFGEQVSLTSDSTFNASIKIEKSQNEEILDDSISDHKEKKDIDYVRYDFRKEAHFDLPAFIKKNPLPLDIAQSMQNWCADSPISSKKDPQFWDAVPIRILSITSEFQFLNGKKDSFVVNSYASEDTCPPNVWMTGTFASEGGDRHRFSLFHDDDFFRYQIGEVQCKDDLVIATKSTDNSLVCVKPETKQKLLERGWSLLNTEISALESIKNHPTVEAFYAKYPDTVEEIRSDHISYVVGSDDGFKVRMNMYFDEKYVLDYIDFHCYFQRIHQNDVPETFILRYLKDFECEKRPSPAVVIIPYGSSNPENQFHLIPEEITVVLGINRTVTWINQDDVPSTLTSSDSSGWSTGIIKPGESAYVTFNETGAYPYHGQPHPWKVGRVIVLEK